MKKRNIVILLVAVVFLSSSAVAFAGRQGEYRNHRGNHQRNNLIAFGVGTVVGLMVGATTQQQYYPQQQQYYQSDGYSSCDRFYNAIERNACERGVADRNYQIQRERQNRAYQYGRGY